MHKVTETHMTPASAKGSRFLLFRQFSGLLQGHNDTNKNYLKYEIFRGENLHTLIRNLH